MSFLELRFIKYSEAVQNGINAFAILLEIVLANVLALIYIYKAIPLSFKDRRLIKKLF